jgi:polyhydroxyalkanoate synthesis regulator phasin
VIAISALSVGSSASAQTPPDDEQAGYGQRYRELLAEELGITVDELTAAQTAARDKAIDEAILAGDLTEEQGQKLKDREIGEGHLGFRLGAHAAGRLHRAIVSVFESAADIIGLPVDEVRERIAGGESLVDIADGQGIDEATLKADLVADLTDKINQAVKNGELAQDKADMLLENLDEMVDRAINAEGPFGGGDGPRGGRLMERFRNR